jgi:hypothetical protein
MNDEEINRAIAEHLGWIWWAIEKGGWYYRQGGAGYTNRIEEAGRYTEADARKELVRGEPMGVHPIPPPNFCGDLNAMHEAEKVLTDVQCLFYPDNMREVITEHDASRRTWHAAARQRAEAFLRVVGKWRGEE